MNDKNILAGIKKAQWIKRWSGSYTFISSAFWGGQYFHTLKKVLGVNFPHTLFFHKKGVVSFYVRRDEFEKLGKKLAAEAVRYPAKAKKRLQILKQNTDQLSSVMRKISGKIPSVREYAEFMKYYERHLPYHVFMKKTVDFLPSVSAKVLLPEFKKARLYSEHIYSDTETFFRKLMQVIAKKEKYSARLLTSLTDKEFESYLHRAVLPKIPELKKRFENSILYFENGKMNILTGANAVNKIEKQISQGSGPSSSKVLKGTIVYAGQAKGVVRIILDPYKKIKFNKGDILVTGMTRPEFLPYIKKASGIITDAGGVLCHAAIIARELHKPCIVGTEIATRFLKTGNKVILDANKGIIKKLK